MRSLQNDCWFSSARVLLPVVVACCLCSTTAVLGASVVSKDRLLGLSELKPDYAAFETFSERSGERRLFNGRRRLQASVASECSGGIKDFTELKPTGDTEAVVYDTKWVGKEDKFLYLLTLGPPSIKGGRVWRSFDAGDTFTDMSPAFLAALPNITDRARESGVVNIHVNPHGSTEDILFQGACKFHWVSSDHGKTLRAVSTPGNTTGSSQILKLHPTKPGWILAMVKRNECDDQGTAYSKLCAKDLFLTKDAWHGMNWANLTEESNGRIAAFVDFDWGAVANEQGKEGHLLVPDEAIFATVYEKKEHLKGAYVGWDKDVHFVRSDDFFKSSHQKLQNCGNQFEIVAGTVFLGVPNSCPVDLHGKKRKRPESADELLGVALYVSNDEALTFHEACIPVPLYQQGYSLVSTHDGDGAFVIIDHYSERQRSFFARQIVSNVYASGEHAALYSLVLKDNYEDPSGFGLDFSRVEGLQGVYIANQRAKNGGDDSFGRPLLNTKITFNGGATWEDIQAPADGAFRNSACNQCENNVDCHLHLHGASSWNWELDSHPSLYSHKNAPGIIMASGNVAPKGSGLGNSRGTCTWLSTDGGITWSDVAVGSYIYEYGDHGGVIVMAKYTVDGPTDEILFSTDEGGCWNSIPLQKALKVDNIRMEPDGQRPRFIVHGSECFQGEHKKCTMDDGSNGDIKGIVYTVDIQDLLSMRMCDRGDYETWVPMAQREPACLLGSEYQLEKRKASSRCLNGGEYVRPPPLTRPCECTTSDTECDYGWVRSEGSTSDKPCQQIADDYLPECKVVEEGLYSVSDTGRRLVHADNCSLSIDLEVEFFANTDGKGKTVRSIHHKRGGLSGAAAFFVWVLVLSIVSIVCALLYRKFAPPHVKERVEEVTTPMSDAVNSAFKWAKRKIAMDSPRLPTRDTCYEPLRDRTGL